MKSEIAQLETRIRRLRQMISAMPLDADVPADLSTDLSECLANLRALREASPVGPYSGLTRSELHRSGTCETDWA